MSSNKHRAHHHHPRVGIRIPVSCASTHTQTRSTAYLISTSCRVARAPKGLQSALRRQATTSVLDIHSSLAPSSLVHLASSPSVELSKSLARTLSYYEKLSCSRTLSYFYALPVTRVHGAITDAASILHQTHKHGIMSHIRGHAVKHQLSPSLSPSLSLMHATYVLSPSFSLTHSESARARGRSA